MKYIYLKILILALLISCSNENIEAQDNFKYRDAVTGLDTPWEILWGPDGYIWFTERYGRISRANPETGEVQELYTIENVFEDGERGLMGMVLHPDFENNPYVYVAYNTGQDNASTEIVLSRLTFDGEKLTDLQVILDKIQGWWNHDGSRLWILEDNTMLMTIGDAAKAETAQDLSNLNGTIIRINLDGSIPEDNPIPDSRIFIYGSRNAQGLVVHNGIIYSSEHGPDTDDEVNIIEAGRNYGWPNVRGFCDTPAEIIFCEANNAKEPLAAWTPTLAVAGIDFYAKNLFPELNNSLLVTSLKAGKLVQLKLDETGKNLHEEITLINNQFGRLRDICIAPDGRIFISTSNKDGRGAPAAQDDRIIEITPKSSSVNDEGNNLIVFPNPAKSAVNFKFQNAAEIRKINIYDIQGRLIKNFDDINESMSWNLTDENDNICPNGIYNAVIFGSGIISQKLLINR